jgi:energy-converting hydrogenase B subunit D
MTEFWVLDYLILGVLLGCAVLVVRIRNLPGATMALSAVGTFLSVLFIVLGAPDDAHSEVVVGAIALPVLFLTAIAKVRADVVDEGELREEGEHGDDQETDRAGD